MNVEEFYTIHNLDIYGFSCNDLRKWILDMALRLETELDNGVVHTVEMVKGYVDTSINSLYEGSQNVELVLIIKELVEDLYIRVYNQ